VGLSAASVGAADLAARPYTSAPAMIPQVYDWTGGYIGGEGGFGGGHSDQTDPGIAPAPPPPPPPPPPPSVRPIGDGHYLVTGGLIGGTLGYNWQAGALVFGLEGDYSWADISGSSAICGPAFAMHSCGTKLESLGTFRGRLGYAIGATGNVLLYATGGLALGDVHAWDALTPASGREFRAGWTVGAGVEAAFAPNWTAKLEYLYVDLGKAHLFDIIPTVPETVSFNTNIIRAGINYKFGGPIVARY
jgi:outer membrane immunogenic protein